MTLTIYVIYLTKKIIYMETPKVGCSTIKYILQKTEDNNFCIENVHNRPASNLAKISDYSIEEIKKIFEEYFIFSFVRNPFTRSLSCYLDKIVYTEWERKRLLPTLNINSDKIISFTDFLLSISKTKDEERDIHFCSQSFLLSINNIKYDFIGRFEYFNEALRTISSTFNIDCNNSIRHSTNAKNRLIEYYTPKNIGLVLSIYKNDFINFCYSTDIRFALI